MDLMSLLQQILGQGQQGASNWGPLLRGGDRYDLKGLVTKGGPNWQDSFSKMLSNMGSNSFGNGASGGTTTGRPVTYGGGADGSTAGGAYGATGGSGSAATGTTNTTKKTTRGGYGGVG